MFTKMLNFLLKLFRKCLTLILFYISNVFWPKIKFINSNTFLVFYMMVGMVQPILLLEYYYYHANYIVVFFLITLSMSDAMKFIFIFSIIFVIYLYIGKSLRKCKPTVLRLIVCIFNIIVHIEFIFYIIYVVL